MPTWKPIDTPTFGVAIYKYEGKGQHCLALNLGESVQILEECPGWYRGFSRQNKNTKGIFPTSFIHLKDVNVQIQGSVDVVVINEAPLVDESTSVLREWGVIWKQLYVKRQEDIFHNVRALMTELMNWRSQIISGALTGDQMKQLKLQITNKIDYGNKQLGLDLVVRNSLGNVIDVDSTGVIELYKRHLESSERVQTAIPDTRPRRGTSTNTLSAYNTHNLYVNIKNMVCKIGDDAEVYVTLYDARESTFISEHYIVRWDKQGMPKDQERLHNLSAIFTDLGGKDLQRDKLYIVCQIIRVGRMELKKDADNKKLTQKLRRPFGVSVLHISDIIQGKIDDEEDKEYFLQVQLCQNDEFLDALIKKCIAKASERQTTGQGIWISLQMLHGDLVQVREEHPILVNKFTAVARKQGFPDVIFPGDVRNDVYISLMTGSFERGNKSANKNINVVMTVHGPDGKQMENVISQGASDELISTYYSCVYYHSASPKWMETVKICVPAECFSENAHIRFTFRHRASNDEKDRAQKIFALSYVRLMNTDGTALKDDIHELAVYKCDLKKIDDIKTYLHLPSFRSAGTQGGHMPKKSHSSSGLSFSKNEAFQISFQLCSTKLAQNVNLLGLLKWRTQTDNLTSILPAVMNVSGEEIVKFLQDTFDALFAILMENPDAYGEMVSDALVFCIGLLADKKYHHFRPVLDAYISNLFSATKAYITLVNVLQKNISSASDDVHANDNDAADSQRAGLRYFKGLEYIIKFIVRSRLLFESTAPGRNRMEFETSINSLLSSIVTMMSNSKKGTLLLQGCALKYMPSVFGDLMLVYDAIQLGYFARDMIERMPQNRLNSTKLGSINQIVKSPLFAIPDARTIVLPMVIDQLKLQFEKMEDPKSCLDIMNDLLTALAQSPEEVGSTDEDIGFIIQEFFRDLVQAAMSMDTSLPTAGNFVACIVCILDLMKDEHYKTYIDSFESDLDLLDVLMQMFLVFREFISNNVYPRDWISMTMIQNHVILRAIQYFSEALYDKFLVGDSFEFQLWNNFFQLAVSFITQDSLQLENFSEAKSQKIIDKYGDMRMVIGMKIVDMWQWLGIHKIKLIPGIVGPFLEMTLIPEAELRRATIPVFFDMIDCEFRNRQHFRQVETEVISQLDVLIEGQKGDEEYKELFKDILRKKFEELPTQSARLAEVGLAFVDTIARLLSRLLDYRTVTEGDDNINNKMSCTVNILYFYQEIKREEMYIRYLYKLCDLHLNIENYTEAAFTLLLHADLLKWSDEPLSGIHQVKYRAQTQRQLKETLYREIINFFDKGKTWEYGIRLCKELASQYELETYDYVQLSQILERQAKFFDNIIRTLIRVEPVYFRVGYYGKGFPTFLRNKSFIYRGSDYEKLPDFVMRLQSQFPSAQFMKTLEPPGEEITASFGQFMQVCKVDPIPVERRRFRGKAVAEQIRKFYEVNDVNQFALSRPFHKGKKDKENEFATLWVERTTMMTAYSFPGILRWFEVSSMNKLEMTPIENALETMRTKNKDIQSMVGRYRADTEASLNPLSMLLNGVIDAAVMGGISNYEKAFFNDEYMAKYPEHQTYMDQLKEYIVDQVDLLEQGLALHGARAPDNLKPFHEKMERCFKEMRQKVSPYRKYLRQHRQSIAPQRPRSIVVNRFQGVRPVSNESMNNFQQDKYNSTNSVHNPGTDDLAPPALPEKRMSTYQPTMSPVTSRDRSSGRVPTSHSGRGTSSSYEHPPVPDKAPRPTQGSPRESPKGPSPVIPRKQNPSPQFSQKPSRGVPVKLHAVSPEKPPPKPARPAPVLEDGENAPPNLPQKTYKGDERESPYHRVKLEPNDEGSIPPIPPRGK